MVRCISFDQFLSSRNKDFRLVRRSCKYKNFFNSIQLRLLSRWVEFLFSGSVFKSRDFNQEICEMRGFAFILMATFAAMLGGEVHAQQVVQCSSCVSTAQYEAAAINAHGTRTGVKEYMVINVTKKELKYVDIQYVPPGHQIQGVEPIPSGVTPKRQVKSQGMVVVPSEDNFLLEDGLEVVVNGSGGYTASTTNASPTEAIQFEAMVSVSANSVLFSAPSGYSWFESFNSAMENMAQVSSVAWAALDNNNPNWAGTVFEPSRRQTLWNVLGMIFGKGPSACIVFYNGDAACFQVNPMAPSAARYIEGTAKDINGDPIASPGGGLPNGGGLGVNVHPNTPRTGYTGWNLGLGRWYLVCSMVGGKLIGCYTQWIPN